MDWKKAKQVLYEDEEFTVSVFLRACDINDITLVRKCIKQGVDPNCHEGDFKTALHIAADNNYYNLVNIIIRLPNIRVNARNNWGCTPLYQACARNHINIVLLLIEFNADVNIPNKNGYTPLHNCVLLSHFELVQILLKNDAEVDPVNIYGITPLYLAVLDSPNFDISELLVRYGANVDENNGKALPILLEGALHCKSSNQVEVLTHFLSLGSSVNIRDPLTGRNALHIVAISNYVPLADVLLNHGANIHARDHQKKTPLDIAQRMENEAMVRFLKYIIIMRNPSMFTTDSASTFELFRN